MELPSRFEILETVCRGGQAEVFRARDRQHDRLVALKVYTGLDKAWSQQGLEEARILLALPPHPGLPIVRDSFAVEPEDRYVVVMDWIDGVDLQKVLAQR